MNVIAGFFALPKGFWAGLAAMIRSQKREASRRGQSGFVSRPTLTDDLEKLMTSR
jgi:hypothetical protein